MIDEATAIRQLRQVELDYNRLYIDLHFVGRDELRPQVDALFDRHAKLLAAIHAHEIHRHESTQLIPWGCGSPDCDFCLAHGVNVMQRIGDMRERRRWNARFQQWEKKIPVKATAREIKKHGADSVTEIDAGILILEQQWKFDHTLCWQDSEHRYGGGTPLTRVVEWFDGIGFGRWEWELSVSPP